MTYDIGEMWHKGPFPNDCAKGCCEAWSWVTIQQHNDLAANGSTGSFKQSRVNIRFLENSAGDFSQLSPQDIFGPLHRVGVTSSNWIEPHNKQTFTLQGFGSLQIFQSKRQIIGEEVKLLQLVNPSNLIAKALYGLQSLAIQKFEGSCGSSTSMNRCRAYTISI